MVSKDEIIKELRNVKDPEIGLDVVDLGLIYDVRVKDEKVEIDMTLTFPGCPLGRVLVDEVEKAAKRVPGVVDVDVNLVFDPPWSPERISDEGKRILGITNDSNER